MKTVELVLLHILSTCLTIFGLVFIFLLFPIKVLIIGFMLAMDTIEKRIEYLEGQNNG